MTNLLPADAEVCRDLTEYLPVIPGALDRPVQPAPTPAQPQPYVGRHRLPKLRVRVGQALIGGAR